MAFHITHLSHNSSIKMASITLLFSLFIIFSIASSSTALHYESPDSYVLENLPQFGLPSGLLPDCVLSHTYDPDTGDFSVEIEKPLYIQFDYLVYYNKKVTGTLKMGSITNLKGIQVQNFFLWLNVDEIKVDIPPTDTIYFRVGIITKGLNVKQFQTVRSCKSSSALSLASFPPSWKLFFDQFELPHDADIDENLVPVVAAQ